MISAFGDPNRPLTINNPQIQSCFTVNDGVWIPDDPNRQQIFGGDLVLTSQGPPATTVAEGYCFHHSETLLQANLSEAEQIVIFVRHTLAAGKINGYGVSVTRTGTLRLDKFIDDDAQDFDDGQNLNVAQADFDVRANDLLIRIESHGANLKATIWNAANPMPNNPTLQAQDAEPSLLEGSPALSGMARK